MFERRLRIVLTLPLVCLLAVVVRLYQIQLLRGEEYLQKADDALVSPRRYLPALRGAIKDRYGRVLVSDEPATDVTVHYGALSMSEPYLLLLADRIRKQEPQWRSSGDAAMLEEARRRIGDMWLALARVSGRSLRELRDRRDSVYASVENLRRYLWSARRARGFDDPIERFRLREEESFHPIVRDISAEARTRIELELCRWPFVRIEPSVRRVCHPGARPLCHILGRMGPVSAEQIEADGASGDPLAGYRADDDAGLSGIERVAEPMLRGRRGFEERYLDGHVKDRMSPRDGIDVQLSIDLDLQARIEELLADVVSQHEASTGASCLVIGVRSREVLAAVSVPTYDPRTLREDYRALRDDARNQPLRFRAVQNSYQPGSILKPAALLAGFANDLVDPGQRVFCGGALIPGADRWHCWTHWRSLPGHGELNAEEALQHSCNIYYYTLGQKLGAGLLTDFYRELILGSTDAARTDSIRGTQLIEESGGLIPTRQWLQEHRHRNFNDADGRNYAIGQGEIQITPLQAANAFATLAAGEFREPTFIANDGRPRPARRFPTVSQEAWRLMRRGLYRCVNEEGGTAFKYAHMSELEICGKTGSAECVPRIIERRYTFQIPTAGELAPVMRSIEAPTIESARERLELPAGTPCVARAITRRWPPGDFIKAEDAGPDSLPKEKVPTHAWFAGFAPYREPKIALAVVIEYGGGGGATAGPAAKAVFQALLASPRGYLERGALASVNE
jgi:cell division protein FtsI/penicillin-binding protein 2